MRYNANSGNYRFRYFKSSTYTSQKAIALYKWTETSSEPACDHNGTPTTWAYDSENKEHYQQCECGAEIENTRAVCSAFTYGKYTTENGTHTRTATCTVCGGEQTESGTCEVTAEYVREGDQHTQTGTCSVCQASTSVTESCTLSYENVSNGNKTHNMTSTCSVCNQSVTTENVACTFDSGVLNGTTLTYTCQNCEYSYTEEATTYTVTYVVPDGVAAIDTVKVAEGFTTVLPTADAEEGYTFVGWVETELTEKTENAPEYFTAGTNYTVTTDVTLYALYSYAEGTGAYTLLKDASALVVGKQIVIVASASNYALGVDKGNNRNAAIITKSSDTVTINDEVQIITLEAGTVDSTFAFNVGNGYLYAASSSSNHLKTKTELDANGSWSITIDANGVATIKAQGTNTKNWLRKNSSSALFACYGSGQNDVSIYMKDGATYYVTEFNTCAHTNTNEVIEEATCTESGSKTVTCLDCEAITVAEIIPATGHNFIDGICENCGKQDPASIIYDGYYYLTLNSKYLDTTTLDSSNRYKPVDFTPGETIEIKHVFHFAKIGNTYTISELTNGVYMESVTIATNNDYSVNIYNSEGNILSHNANANYIGFYKTTNSYARDFTLTQVELTSNIDSASLTVKEDIAANYYVELSEALAENAVMHFTVNETTYDVKGTLEENGERYVFSLDLPPHYMTEVIKAELKYNDLVLDTIEEYSIQTYTQNQLNKIKDGSLVDTDGKLKQLLTDMLYYGAAAQTYTNYNVDNLATTDITNIGEASSAVPTEPTFSASPINADGVTEFGAYFTAANVWFDSTNKVMVKISTTENVTMKINDVEVEITGTTIYTEELLPTQFDEDFKFELYYNGTLMQTLTYSINAYAYKMKDNAKMSALALALYRYGLSAENYTA